jgi:hypothetical protein
METTEELPQRDIDQTDNDICRVCELVDNDRRLKPVLYCSICDAKICDNCRPNITRRAIAAIREKFFNIKK